MTYQGKQVELLSTRTTFGKSVSRIRVLVDSQVLDVPAEELKEDDASLSLHELAFKAMVARIRNEVAARGSLAPLESNIIPLPHQILALEKVMSGSYLRFLLADEVGMGKTIEAGLVLKELKLRGIVKRTLIIVPVSAMQQWRSELKQHFNESFHIYDSEYIGALARTFSKLEAENEINIWKTHNQLIVSMDALKPLESRQNWSKEQVEEYNRYRIRSVIEADFDLVIIDECHKVGGGSTLVGRFQMAQILCNAIPNVLLLSATPHRGKSDHFRRILGLLDADAFAGEGMPSIPELEPYVVRTDKRQSIDYEGKALFNTRVTERVVVQYDPQRHARQEALYEDLTEYVVNGFNLASTTKNTSYGFVMILFQRMLSSSTQAILDAMEKRAGRLTSEREEASRESVAAELLELGYSGQFELDFESKVTAALQNTKAAYATELELLNGLIRQAREVIDCELDAKLEYLLGRMADIKAREDNPDTKFIIFTEFTATQRMLARELSERGGYVCEAINGSMDFEKRVEALKAFKSKAQVLVSTDAAGESLNMQFAHVVFNYDMPWNPMVIEQRIGRVDRIGQTHEVLAVNVMQGNSVDERVYDVIETKLGQIMAELGIDKTSDVLDSTLERESVNNLFLASLLDPKRFKAESDEWLSDIKKKLNAYRSTEGSLPTIASGLIKTDKSDEYRHSPVPIWLENATLSWLTWKGLRWSRSSDGIIAPLPGSAEKAYTFDTRRGLENPIPEPLTLQHEVIQRMFADAVPLADNARIPILIPESKDAPSGYWTLWALMASNQFSSHESIYPLFISDEGDLFPAFANDLLVKISQASFPGKIIGYSDSETELSSLRAKAEETLMPRYLEMEREIAQATDRIKTNKDKALEFQSRQISRIGIEAIKNYRLQKLETERKEWIANYESASRVVPDLHCLLALRIRHE